MPFYNSFVPSITIANVTLANSNAIVLMTYADNTKFDTLKKKGTAYQVSSGKTLIIRAVKVNDASVTAAGPTVIGYGDSAVSNAAGAPTNAVALWSNGIGVSPGSVGATVEMPCYFEIPSGKYPYISGSNSAICTYLCEEV